MGRIIHQTIAGGKGLVALDMNDLLRTLKGADYVDVLCFEGRKLPKIKPMQKIVSLSPLLEDTRKQKIKKQKKGEYK